MFSRFDTIPTHRQAHKQTDTQTHDASAIYRASVAGTTAGDHTRKRGPPGITASTNMSGTAEFNFAIYMLENSKFSIYLIRCKLCLYKCSHGVLERCPSNTDNKILSSVSRVLCGRAATVCVLRWRIVERPRDIEVSCEISRVFSNE